MKHLNNTFKYFCAFTFILIPFFLLGQENTAQEVSFFEGDNAFEGWFMDVFAQIDLHVWDEANLVKRLGQAIGAIGALIYLSYIGFQMQEGARPWEVSPMIRPIIVALILANWSSFCRMLQYPFEEASNPSIALFEEIQEEAETRRVLRYEKQTQLLSAAIEAKAKEDAKNAEAKALSGQDNSWFDFDLDIGSVEDLFAPIKEWEMRFDFQLQQFVANLIDNISLAILRICTYFIFIIQKIWGYILITLGPIAIGISLIPGFENSLNAWIAKFININLYSYIAYQIINIGQMMIISAYEMEIDRMSQIIDSNGIPTDLVTLTNYITNQGFISSIMFTVVAYLVTAIALLMTPSISDSIVSAGSAGIMSKGKRAGNTVKQGLSKATKFVGV